MTDALMDRIKAHRSARTVYDPPTFDQMADRIEQTEAKLAKAVEALRELVTCVEDGCYCSEAKMAGAMDDARTALAELEGMK